MPGRAGRAPPSRNRCKDAVDRRQRAGDDPSAGPAAAPAGGARETRGAGTTMERATFGAGCFWGVEEAFRRIDGVTATAVGYSGGTLEDPTYKDVCSGTTGHAEVVRVDYDPARVNYEELLRMFWDLHDPTTLNRQGADVGTQYRSVVFFHGEEQAAAARAAKETLQASGRYPDGIVTEIAPASTFYMAEDYHQRYVEKLRRSPRRRTL